MRECPSVRTVEQVQAPELSLVHSLQDKKIKIKTMISNVADRTRLGPDSTESTDPKPDSSYGSGTRKPKAF